ncbi:MAG TPA: bifunctional hydroxymethylpyrimidine kinase/phosphomethylpyrimidine kinase [Candidatus Limnocylindria bacterium]|nr:bifunctional hydroxymethylpyrimidine kinase/phosphomethylpyrimidine kinase [Candidatus Limnocylindria bacterium]
MTSAALTIAGSDPSGGAGIQADLKTFAAYRVYGAAVLTALTAQNTRGVRTVEVVPPDFLAAQLDAVLDDLRIGAIKTGMLPNGAAVEVVARAMARVPSVPLVVDPVLVSTSGHALADASTVTALRTTLLPRAHLVTPNLAEAEALLGTPVRSPADMQAAARALVGLGARAALVKGGHLTGSAYDVLCAGDRVHEFDAPRLTVASTHGTGCALSAAIAAALARGEPLVEAVGRAKRYVHRALERAVAIGGGVRLLDHSVGPDNSG